MLRVLIGIAALWTAAGCDLGGGNRAGASLLSSSGGEVALADGGSLHFGITSDKFRQWDRAQRAIGRGTAARFGEILQPDSPTERSIDRAVSYLGSQPAARLAIENSGMSIREFVVMTVALEQEMRLASGEGPYRAPPEPQPYEFPIIDTMFVPPQPVVPEYPVPETLALDTPASVDTLFPRPIFPDTSYPARTPTVFRRDTSFGLPRRDTTFTRSDTAPRPVRPDTAFPRPRPVRDTIIPDTPAVRVPAPVAPLPPDTLRGA